MLSVLEVKDVTIGKFYMVPCIKVPTDIKGYKTGEFCPIIGSLHSDALLDFPYDHYHYDRRFIPRAKYIEWSPSDWAAGVVMRYLARWDKGYSAQGEMDPRWIGLKIESRKFKCHRQMPTYTFLPSGLDRLEDSMQEKKMCNRICPHQGVSLAGIPVDANNEIVCPGHGLRWNVNTGALIKRC